MVTAFYSILHLLVDGICAFAMFGKFVADSSNYEFFLIYNFCAFALQMPCGGIVDLLSGRYHKNISFVCAVFGVMLTIFGAVSHPAILGIGNALFHVGGGVEIIKEDNFHDWKGQALGIFVASGALGLFIGKQFASQWNGKTYLWFLGIVSLWAVMVFYKIYSKATARRGFEENTEESYIAPLDKDTLGLTICCFLVVVLRSFIGMVVTFSWKTTFLLSIVSVLAVVFGKMAGGIFSVKLGMRNSVIASLVLAAACYLLSESAVFGIAALFFFNMTMPITLYLLVCKWKELAGFSFGLLTFGLFLGFLPVYFGVDVGVGDNMLGAIGSIVSLLLLLAYIPRKE